MIVEANTKISLAIPMNDPKTTLYTKKQMEMGNAKNFVRVGFPFQKLYTDKTDATVGSMLNRFSQVITAEIMLNAPKNKNHRLRYT